MKQEKGMTDWDVGKIFHIGLDIGEIFDIPREDGPKK